MPLPKIRLPRLAKEKSSGSDESLFKGLPATSKDSLHMLKTIGRGSFGHVSLCKKGNNVLILKEFFNDDENTRRLLAKEAKLMNMMRHENVVSFHSICTSTTNSGIRKNSILMDYVCFDFKPFGHDSSVSSLKDFLKLVDLINYKEFEHFNHFIATDVSNGLNHLHDHDVAHRDLKPDNVLVCNRHYSELNEDDRSKYWMSKPVVTKLTDFGESRAALVQTNTLVHSVTANVFRGTPVFMAPEVLQHDGRSKMDIDDMKNADIWSYSMILFILMNPDLKYPYQLEIAEAEESDSLKEACNILRTMFEAQKLPRNSSKYQELRKTEWSTIAKAYSQCAQFKTDRPSAANVALLFKGSTTSSRISGRHLDIIMAKDHLQFTIPTNTPIVPLECTSAFSTLSSKEKHYAHYLSRADWAGGLICLLQTSPESPLIFSLLYKLFKVESVEELSKKVLEKVSGLTEEDVQAFLMYCAAFLSNMGNYKSFGDTKFIPDISKEKFEGIVKCSIAYSQDQAGIDELLSLCASQVYSLDQKVRQLGLGGKGSTTYFSSNCTEADAELAKEFMSGKKIQAYNTRLFKSDENGKTSYEIRLASSETDDSQSSLLLGNHIYSHNGTEFRVTRGDYAPLMAKVVENLKKAKEFAANDNEAMMLESFISSFTSGSLDAHMDGTRYWIRDTGPIVESYIGFIETYRDPFGVRGEWEGFVAIVNKAMSAKFGNLVKSAEDFLPLLPWPKEYEKDTFLRPDFTSLEVLSFASSGIPAGINIPNYDHIRQNEGFKNVSLGNVFAAHSKDQIITFLADSDKELYTKMKVPSFEVQVGLHELLGHGSGKIFMKDDNGELNFNQDEVIHTETKEKVSTWYSPGETWDSKFPVISSSYEECRAECVGLYLCLSREILKIFGHEDQTAADILYINWLNMVRAGVLGLEFYTPETTSWRQAHMQARFVILRVLIEAGQGLVSIERCTGEDGNPDAKVTLDREKIETVGKEAIGNFLRKLQVYKAVGDYETGKQLYEKYSAVNDDTPEKFLSLRGVVLARKQPRRMFVQVNTTVSEDDEVVLSSYEGSPSGMIQSFIDRYSDDDYCKLLQELWQKDSPHFT